MVELSETFVMIVQNIVILLIGVVAIGTPYLIYRLMTSNEHLSMVQKMRIKRLMHENNAKQSPRKRKAFVSSTPIVRPPVVRTPMRKQPENVRGAGVFARLASRFSAKRR